MFGFSDGSGWHGNDEDFWYDVSFQSISALISLNILNIGDVPRDNRRVALSLKSGLGFMGISGDNTNGEINQSMFSTSAVSIPAGIELKYKMNETNRNYSKKY